MNEFVLGSASGFGIVVSLLTKYLVEAKWFPWVSEENAPRIRALAALLSAISACIVAWESKNLSSDNFMDVINTAVIFVNTLGISTLFHHWFILPTEEKVEWVDEQPTEEVQ